MTGAGVTGARVASRAELMVDQAVSGFARAIETLGAVTPSGSAQRFGDAVAVTTGAKLASLNYVMAMGRTPTKDDVVAAASALRATGLPWGMEFRTDPGPEITELAAGLGLHTLSRPVFMVAAADDLVLGETSRVGVEAVGADRWEEYTRVLTQGFETPEGVFGTLMGGPVLDVPGFTGYLAFSDEGTAVGTGMATITEDGALSVFNIAVVPSARGRGVGRALTGTALEDGLDRGARVACLQTSAMGRPLYESLGLREAEAWYTFG
ncbi:GNAT family N-acetyltransferase [Kineosporia succinea]|uniref:Ribosomal protein S18 acetylase RimI-like enzyme n=1 Tax=Kineosporia succinea TaxID=84632 RepID=A0ABT9P7F7_9ACTN|nr:GNAT family N-acetyltransferase [Kineosporia succinea]MDP9828641.1 ribosomal protein S18 acetylase RimI-like enzyme [Kineosporia succinea]